MAYGDFKDLKRRIFYDKVLRDKTFNIVKNPKHDEYHRWIASVVYKFFDKKSTGSGRPLSSASQISNDIKQNIQLAKELHKPINRNFQTRTIFSRSKDNIWSADLADM